MTGRSSDRLLGILLALMPFAVSAQAEQPCTIYDGDPRHLWNRVHSAFYLRTVEIDRYETFPDKPPNRVAVGSVTLGPDVLDPPLGGHPKFLLWDEPFNSCEAVLTEFLESDGAKLIADPRARVVLQRDLWAVFDLLQADPKAAQPGRIIPAAMPEYTQFEKQRCEILSLKIARVMRALALPREQLIALPDNYAQAVGSGVFSREPVSQQRADFLPPDLFESASGWVEVGYARQTAPTLHGQLLAGRSLFRIFYRVANEQGGAAAVERMLVEEIDSEPGAIASSSFPPGSSFSLVRQLIALDDQLEPVVTPIVESVQLRADRAAGAESSEFGQLFEEFVLERQLLLADRQGGLKPARVGELRFDGYGSLGRLFTDEHGRMLIGGEFPRDCAACHGSHMLIAMSRLSFGGTKPVSHLENSPAQQAVAWKKGLGDYRRLRELWFEGR